MLVEQHEQVGGVRQQGARARTQGARAIAILLSGADPDDPAAEQGFRRILVTEPDHPYVAAWWPPGHGLGYEHGFTHQAVDLVTAIAEGRQPTPSFADGLQVQRVLAAVEASSAADSAWTAV